MAVHDPSAANTPHVKGHSARNERNFRVGWSGIIGGTALGWGLFSLLTLLGAAVGFAKIDPYSAHPASGLGVSSGIFGVVALMASSFFGAFVAVRIASESRRSGALLHGGVCWAFSMLLGGMLALGAARTATESAAAVASGTQAQAKAQRESNVRAKTGGPTPADRERASDVADTAAKTTGAGAGAAFLALIASLVGALAASRVSTGKRMTSGPRHGTSDRQSIPERRDEATSLPAMG
jgi:uncharacterized membrane protein